MAAPTGRSVRGRRLLALATVLVLALSLSGCRLLDLARSLGCTAQDVEFPTDDRIIGGFWEGEAVPVSGDPVVLAVALSLDVELAAEWRYDVRGELVVDDGAPLRVDGSVVASCWERFVVAGAASHGSGGGTDPEHAAVERALSQPLPSQFEARLIDADGVEVGTLSIVLDGRSDDHRMVGPLRLHDHSYTIDVERQPLDAGSILEPVDPTSGAAGNQFAGNATDVIDNR